MTTPQPAALPEFVTAVDYPDNLSDTTTSRIDVRVPIGSRLALQAQPAARNIAAELSLMVLCAVKDLPGLHANMLKDIDSAIEANRAAAQPAEVSDAEIERCALESGFGVESSGAIWAVDGHVGTRVDPGLRKFARAILALRPQSSTEGIPVPTTADQAAAMQMVGQAWLEQHAPERLRPQAVPMTPRMVELLAGIEPEDQHEDNGAGLVICPACNAYMTMQWEAGQRIDNIEDLAHDEECPAVWARAQLVHGITAQGAKAVPMTDEQRALIIGRAADKTADRSAAALYAICETERLYGITAPGAQDGEVGRG